MVLLELLRRYGEEHSCRIVVAHFNHCLRGRSSDADEALVRRTARRLGTTCKVGRADVRSWARRYGISIEMAARQKRHQFLARTARILGIRKVALAHHADDQVELFFLRLLRGAGPEALAGMRQKSPSPADPTVQLIRPLLEVPKMELERFASEERVRFRNDA